MSDAPVTFASLSADLDRLGAGIDAKNAEIASLRSLLTAAQAENERLRPVYEAAKVVAAKRLSCDCEDCATARVRLRQAVVDAAMGADRG